MMTSRKRRSMGLSWLRRMLKYAAYWDRMSRWSFMSDGPIYRSIQSRRILQLAICGFYAVLESLDVICISTCLYFLYFGLLHTSCSASFYAFAECRWTNMYCGLLLDHGDVCWVQHSSHIGVSKCRDDTKLVQNSKYIFGSANDCGCQTVVPIWCQCFPTVDRVSASECLENFCSSITTRF